MRIVAGTADNRSASPSITGAQQARAALRPSLRTRPQRDMPRRDSMRGEGPGVVRLSLTSLLHVSRDYANPYTISDRDNYILVDQSWYSSSK